MKFDASWLILSPVVDSGRTFGFVRQPNHQATFLCLGLGALFCIQAQVSRRVGFILFLILAPILIFGIVSTGSRSGSLQLASILVAAFVFCRKNQCGSWKVPFALSVAVLIWGALYVLAEYDVLEFYGASKIAQTRTEGIGIRHEIWRSTLNLIFERPWFGWGISSYASIFLLSGAAEKVGVMMTHSHNLFLQLAFSFGIPTAVLFCALMALVLWKVRTQIFTPLGFFGFIVLACLFIHSQIEFPLWYAYFLLPAAYVLGWLAQSTNGHSILHVEKSPAQNPKVSRSRPKFHKSIAAGLGLALIGTSVWINNDYYRITPIFARGLKVNLEERLAVANSVTWLGQYPAFLTLLRTKVDPLNYKAYLESASKLGCQFHDIWYQPPTILALTYAGETDDAKWILYSFWRISGGNTSYFKPSLAESGTPEALDILAFVEDPQPVPKSIITFDAACYDR